jgi:mRNA-degrading endonuclease HigB of HigAB toxin-antitoxin module
MDFWQRHREMEQPLRVWLSVVRRAERWTMADDKAVFAKASIGEMRRLWCRACGVGNLVEREPARSGGR